LKGDDLLRLAIVQQREVFVREPGYRFSGRIRHHNIESDSSLAGVRRGAEWKLLNRLQRDQTLLCRCGSEQRQQQHGTHPEWRTYASYWNQSRPEFVVAGSILAVLLIA
jgi:hypothetical protein